MLKYQVGDKVRVVDERVCGMNDFGKMDEYLGEVVTISGRSEYDNFPYKILEDEGAWSWSENMFQGNVDVLNTEKLTTKEIVKSYMKGEIDEDEDWTMCKPKKYHLELDIGLDISDGCIYVNYVKSTGKITFNTIYEDGFHQTKFTNDEIKDLEIPIEHFKKIEVR